MLRNIVTLVLFAWVFCLSQADEEKLYTCTAWGDPHVTRFQTDSDDKPSEVWCQKSGPNSLVVNEFLTSSVVVSEKPYVITKFNFAFLDDAGAPICTVTQTEFVTPSAECDNGVVLTRNGDSITIAYKEKDIFVTISKNTWDNAKSPVYYSITVSQSGLLIDHSTGLCKTSCDPVSGQPITRRTRAISNQNSIQKSAATICQNFISKLVPKFQSSSLNQMSIESRNAYSACVKDLEITGDLSFAKAGVESLAVNLALAGLTHSSDFKTFSDKIFKELNEASKLASKEISQFKDPVTPSKDDGSVVFLQYTTASISCRDTWSKVVKIQSASYESDSASCSIDVTARVRDICAKKPRSCEFTVSNAVLGKDRCSGEDKQLKVIYRCE